MPAPSCLASHPKALSRGATGHFNGLLYPGAWRIASPPGLNVDFVMNSTLLIKALQVRQQRGLRELHRFWCWPQRSSHGLDQLGSWPCTLTPGPAPKSTTTLLLCRSVLPLILSPEIARRSSLKKFNIRVRNKKLGSIFAACIAMRPRSGAVFRECSCDSKTRRTPKLFASPMLRPKRRNMSVLQALAKVTAALPPDICAFGDSSTIAQRQIGGSLSACYGRG